MKQAQFVREVKKLLSKRGYYYTIAIERVYEPLSPNKVRMRYSIYSGDSAIAYVEDGQSAFEMRTPRAALTALKKRLKELDESPQPDPSTT